MQESFLTSPVSCYSLCRNNVRMRAWRTVIPFKSSHPQRRFLSSRYTFKGNCKAVFMEKSSVNGLNRHLWPGGGLPVFPRRFPSSQGPFARLQFLGHQIRDSLTERDRPANQCNVYSAGTVINNLIQRGGDAAMG